jgi:hypothetical protein
MLMVIFALHVMFREDVSLLSTYFAIDLTFFHYFSNVCRVMFSYMKMFLFLFQIEIAFISIHQ